MAYKLLDQAERTWRKLDCAIKLLWVVKGVRFIDGEPECSLEILELRQRQALTPTPTNLEAPAQATP
jgi:hypothetical protein